MDGLSRHMGEYYEREEEEETRTATLSAAIRQWITEERHKQQQKLSEARSAALILEGALAQIDALEARIDALIGQSDG